MTSVFPFKKSPLASFQEPIVEELERFRVQYKTTLESGIKVIDRVVNYLTRSHGKGLRPILTLLCAKLNDKPLNENAIKAAVIVELLHEATLVHDDVVDDSPQRRGIPTLKSKFNNKVSVLFGDYMLANALTETLGSRDLRWLDILSETAKRMARGELVQAARSKRMNMKEDDYLKMIGDKTAALFAACCKMGGVTGELDDRYLEPLGELGENFGAAFQIKDDMLDLFGNGSVTGKPIGGDLKEKKLTLPLIYALERADPKQSKRIRARIRRGVKSREIETIAEFIKEQGGDKYAQEYMDEKTNKAKKLLESFPDTPARSKLTALIEFAVTRKR